MLNKKATNIKQRYYVVQCRQQQNKKLELETKKMEQELQRIRKFKALELQKQKLKIQMKQLQQQNKETKVQSKNQEAVLRGYGEKLKKQTQQRVKKVLQNKKLTFDNSPRSEQEDNDTQNLKYFLSVIGSPQYLDVLVQNKITTLAKLRQIDEANAKKMNIPLKDMIKINKKLRSMGY